jgi:transposase
MVSAPASDRPNYRTFPCFPSAAIVCAVSSIGTEIGDASGFKSSAHLAAYAGIALSPTAPAAASRASTPRRFT